MFKNYLIIGVLIIVAVIAGTVFFEKSRSDKSMKAEVSALLEEAKKPSDGIPAAQPIQENVVIHTNDGYSPETLRVKSGTTVTFKNEGSAPTWTASDVCPTHRLYPTTGGCIGSTFDACREIVPDDSWQFEFDIVGTWKYHNHLNPEQIGTIIVE